MGYYNPLLIYGEEKITQDAREAGVNGFIVVDLPPEEAVRFRNLCARAGLVPSHGEMLSEGLANCAKPVLCSAYSTRHLRISS